MSELSFVFEESATILLYKLDISDDVAIVCQQIARTHFIFVRHDVSQILNRSKMKS